MNKDAKDFDKAIREAEEFFPQAIVENILSGENAVMVFRKYRGLTQEVLSEKTGLSLAYIAQIEASKETISISTLKKIAKVLNMDIDLLINKNLF